MYVAWHKTHTHTHTHTHTYAKQNLLISKKSTYLSFTSSVIWIYYNMSRFRYKNIEVISKFLVIQFWSYCQKKEMATERVNVFHCKITPECHFHPRKRLFSVILVALLHSVYTIADSICRRTWSGNIVGKRSRSTKLQWPFVARGENQITKATMQTKDDLGIEGASLFRWEEIFKEGIFY